MLLFVGKEEKGYFAEEGYDVIYVDSNLHIEEQSAAILQLSLIHISEPTRP